MALKLGSAVSALVGAIKTVAAPAAAPSTSPAPVPPAQEKKVAKAAPAAKKAASKEDPAISAAPAKSWDDSPYNVPLPEGEYTILHALKEKFLGKEGTLMLIKKSNGTSYVVKGFDEEKVVLEGTDGLTFRPRVGQREVPLYEPMWRE